MSQIQPSIDPTAIQRARAHHLFGTLLEPWSDRRIAARTGIGKNAIGKRRVGITPLSMSDIELLAPLARMTPEQLFKELREVQLPHLDSNQEPIGSRLAPVTRLTSRSRDTTTRETPATVTRIRTAK